MEFGREEIRLPGGVLSYLVAGSGRPMLYIHGGEGVRTSDALSRLSAERRIYAPILPGFNGTRELEGVQSVRQLAVLLGDFAKTMIGGPCDIVGHSFGGWVALSLAAERPDCVDHLVLESPLGFLPESRAELLGEQGIAPDRLYAHPEQAAGPAKPAELVQQNRRVLSGYAGNVAAGEEVAPALCELACATLVLAGASDDLVTPAAIRLLKSSLRKSYLIYVYDARHLIEIDQPARFLGVVTDFLTWGEAFLVNRADQRTPFSRTGDVLYG